jgi:hypothetical protein
VFYPVPGRIKSEWKILDAELVDVVIYMQQNTVAGLSEECVGEMGDNVITRKLRSGRREAFRSQEFLHREMGKLNDL